MQCWIFGRKPQNEIENLQRLNILLFSFHVAIYRAVEEMVMDPAVQTEPANLVANIESFSINYLGFTLYTALL